MFSLALHARLCSFQRCLCDWPAAAVLDTLTGLRLVPLHNHKPFAGLALRDRFTRARWYTQQRAAARRNQQ